MNINWNEAPTGATHWDNRADLFCKDGYFWHGNKWQPTPSHLGWATDRYTPRPVNTGAIDCTEAPDQATHWDTKGNVWCNVYGFWSCLGHYFYMPSQVGWGTDRYVERPVHKMGPDWPSAPVDATHWDMNARVWCRDTRFWSEDVWCEGNQQPGYVEKNYVARPVDSWQPEVGEVCECDWVGAGCFSKAIVRYVGEKIIIVSCDGSERVIFVEEAEQLRPVRTQAQTEREDLIHTASQVLYNNDVLTEWGAAEALFEAGMLKRPKD